LDNILKTRPDNQIYGKNADMGMVVNLRKPVVLPIYFLLIFLAL